MDTHALYWLVSGEDALSNESLVAIGTAQAAGKLFVSPITAWEMSLAVRKKNNAPQIGALTVQKWFRSAVAELSAKVVPIGHQIALNAAKMIEATGHKDPGDCYIMATAKHKKVPVITRDEIIVGIGATGFVNIIEC